MPNMTIDLRGKGLFDAILALEAVSNIRVMSAHAWGEGFADLYYIKAEPTEIDAQNYSCIHAADDEV